MVLSKGARAEEAQVGVHVLAVGGRVISTAKGTIWRVLPVVFKNLCFY